MRSFITLCVLSFLSCLVFVPGARAQYVWHAKIQAIIDNNHGYDFYAVACNGNNCTAAGQYVDDSVRDSVSPVQVWTKMFRSTDAGNSWSEQDPGLQVYQGQNSNTIIRIQQIDSLNIVASGDTGLIIHTFDGGKTWERQDLPNPPIDTAINYAYSGRVMDIHFSDAATGIAVSEYPVFCYTTTDSGRHWNSIMRPPSCLDPEGCHSYGNGMYRMLSIEHGGTLYTTRDNWQTYDSSLVSGTHDSTIDFTKVGFSNGDTIIAAGIQFIDNFTVRQLYIRRTTDGGQHWYQVEASPDQLREVHTISSLDHDFIMMGGIDSGGPNLVMVSTDRGDTWNVDTIPYDTVVRGPYYEVNGLAVTGTGHAVMIAGGPLAILEPAPTADVTPFSTSANGTYIHPNPASDMLHVESYSGTISILDPLGRSYAVKQTGNALDISSLPSGVYFVSDGASRAKFVKE